MILNEDQTLLRDTAKEFFTEKAPISQLRKLRDENSQDGFDRDTWKSMVELGWAGVPFPEEVAVSILATRDWASSPRNREEPSPRVRCLRLYGSVVRQ